MVLVTIFVFKLQKIIDFLELACQDTLKTLTAVNLESSITTSSAEQLPFAKILQTTVSRLETGRKYSIYFIYC